MKMRSLLITVIWALSFAYGEHLADVQICFPWTEELDTEGRSEPDTQQLRDLAKAGVFKKIQEIFYPDLNASLQVADDRPFLLHVKDAEMEDIVGYCNLCRIYAELVKEKNESDALQVDAAPRTIYLNRLKAALHSLYHARPSSADEAKIILGTDDIPLIVSIRQAHYNKSYLIVADTWQISSDSPKEPSYRLLFVPTQPEEDAGEVNELLYQFAKERRPELTHSQFIFEKRLATLYRTMIIALTSHGCLYRNDAQRYSLKEIRDMLNDPGKGIY